jgi:hypothetical protein
MATNKMHHLSRGGEKGKEENPRDFALLFYYQVFTSLPYLIAPLIRHACRTSARQSLTEALGSLAGSVYPHSRIPSRVERMRGGGSCKMVAKETDLTSLERLIRLVSSIVIIP